MTIAPLRMHQIHTLLQGSGFEQAELMPLAGDASFRRYIRLQTSNKTAMLMDAPPDKEDVRPYLMLAEHLHNKAYSAPAILARDVSAGLLLLEDLGDDSFTRLLKFNQTQEDELYSAAVSLLAQWHMAPGFATPQNLSLPIYDRESLEKETGLFSQWFLPYALPDQATELAIEFDAIWKELLAQASLETHYFVHRDYHADNLMWLPQRQGIARVGLLDFQDAVYGDAAYDLASLLEDARRDVPRALADKMLSFYLEQTGVEKNAFSARYALLAAQRNCKIIGIFSRLAIRDHKPHYLHYLPRVWQHLERDMAHELLSPLKCWIDKNIPSLKRRNKI